MKKSFFTLLLLFTVLFGFSQIDTALNKKVDMLTQNVSVLKNSIDSLTKKSTFVQQCYDCKHSLSWKQILIVLSPILLFLVVVLYASIRLKREGFKLADALDETDPKIKTIPNPEYNATTAAGGVVPPTINVTDTPNRSSSRMIAFLSGLTAIVIAISSASYFFYMYFRTGKEPDITHIYDILLALGIGVTPYAFNKISDAIKK